MTLTYLSLRAALAPTLSNTTPPSLPSFESLLSQQQLEREAAADGQKRYENRREYLGVSGSPAGKAVIRSFATELAEAIREYTADDVPRGRGRPPVAIARLRKIDPTSAAVLTLAHVLDGVADPEETFTSICVDLGESIAAHTSPPEVWSDKDRLHVGKALIEMLDSCSGLIAVERDTADPTNTPLRLVLTDKAVALIEVRNCIFKELAEPLHKPMVIPPRPWTDVDSGGYYYDLQAKAQLVRRQPIAKLWKSAVPAAVFSAINSAQATPWRVNRSVLDVMLEFAEPAPSKSSDKRAAWLARKRTRAVAQQFKDESRIYFPHYADFRGRIYPYANFLSPQGDDTARALLEFAEGKPLGDRGIVWLKVHVANLFGQDKCSFAERVAWVNEHVALLHDSAACPLDGKRFWQTAKKPWQALAACFELGGVASCGAEYVSHIPVALDGSCSGLQHFSALLHDADGAATVNLVPSDTPRDVYSIVAARAQELSDADPSQVAPAWRRRVTRSLVKGPVMTMGYGAVPYATRARLIEELGEEALEEYTAKFRGSDHLLDRSVQRAIKQAAEARGSLRGKHIAPHIQKAIEESVRGAPRALGFLQECALVLTRAGLSIRWTTPSGLPVLQQRFTTREGVVELNYRGRRLQVTLTHDTSRLDGAKQKTAIAANFVHSLDAAHLMTSINCGTDNGLSHWAVIHDSFGVHAADIDLLHAVLRATFAEQYINTNWLEAFRTELAARLPPEIARKLPPVPDIGTLDVAKVERAEYAFA